MNRMFRSTSSTCSRSSGSIPPILGIANEEEYELQEDITIGHQLDKIELKLDGQSPTTEKP